MNPGLTAYLAEQLRDRVTLVFGEADVLKPRASQRYEDVASTEQRRCDLAIHRTGNSIWRKTVAGFDTDCDRKQVWGPGQGPATG